MSLWADMNFVNVCMCFAKLIRKLEWEHAGWMSSILTCPSSITHVYTHTEHTQYNHSGISTSHSHILNSFVRLPSCRSVYVRRCTRLSFPWRRNGPEYI